MTSKERVDGLRAEEPDRVPINYFTTPVSTPSRSTSAWGATDDEDCDRRSE